MKKLLVLVCAIFLFTLSIGDCKEKKDSDVFPGAFEEAKQLALKHGTDVIVEGGIVIKELTITPKIGEKTYEIRYIPPGKENCHMVYISVKTQNDWFGVRACLDHNGFQVFVGMWMELDKDKALEIAADLVKEIKVVLGVVSS